ncbi:ras-specific guanine nucleotide-releasing factor RalGPS2-like [Acropora muricata]|uniref:ras-specific guanine nucleotide-releasing factor RalGPS2-like n=1 Tax=Acropora muricata TaxID=159855 RepID=UPI0034E42925
MSTPKASFTNHCLLKAEMSPKINIAMSTEELHEGNSCGSSEEDEIDSTEVKKYDAAVFDMIKVQPEEFAQQLTILDLAVFKLIQPDELSGCGWTKKIKLELAPNVVALTKRFNHTSFWVVREILNANRPKIRAAVLTHFIRIAKKLLELNNLHSLKAVISGLQSAPIFRLDNTWALIQKKDRAVFDKLAELLSEEDNKKNLRKYLSSVKLPCIPYLGMYLTDLTYIDTIHPNTGGLDDARTRKMNDIIRLISEFQQSNYENLESSTYIQSYLSSVNYIEELQKFVEDDNYKLSLQIEPKAGMSNLKSKASKSRESISDVPRRSPAPSRQKFVAGHRKSASLGANIPSFILENFASAESLSCSVASSTGSRNLLDDSMLTDDKNSPNGYLSKSDVTLDRCSIFSDGSSEGSKPSGVDKEFVIEGVLKRKKILKGGRKLAVSSWQKFWVGLSGNWLHFFLPKHRTFGRRERDCFKKEARKLVNIADFTVLLLDDPRHPDVFQLTDSIRGNSYKFKAGNKPAALTWYTYVRQATNENFVKTPQNLMTFEESEEQQS